MNNALFRLEAVRFANDTMPAEVSLRQPLSFRVLTILGALLLAVIVVALLSGDYTRKETVRGYIEPDGGVVSVFPVQRDGRVSRVLVQQGESVEQGQALLQLILPQHTGQGTDVADDLRAELKHQQQLLAAELNQAAEQFTSEAAALQHRLGNVRREIVQQQTLIDLQQKKMELAKQYLADLNSAYATGAIPGNRQLQAQTEMIDGEKALLLAEQHLVQLRSNATALQYQLQQLPNKEHRELRRIRMQISTVAQSLAELEGRYSRMVTAPVAGRVSSILVNAGHPTKHQTPLVRIIPNHMVLESVLVVPSTAIGFLVPGQTVRLMLDAFPYQKFGTIAAEVMSISSAPVLPGELQGPLAVKGAAFLVRAAIPEPHLQALGRQRQLQAGMLLSANVLLEERSLFEWLLAPLYSHTRKLT
ncbi:MAG: HlyD family efflux transporter periplasmic adaptor subunit [Pseudomonadota bacterium]